MNYYIQCWKKFATFSGRARRKEFWMFVLFNAIFSVMANIADGIIGTCGVVSGLYSLAVLIPGLAVGFRRLHDAGHSGWWCLLPLIPIVGAIVLIVFYCQDSVPGGNKYGPSPKAAQ